MRGLAARATRAIGLLGRHRGVIQAVLDLACWAGAVITAAAVRFEFDLGRWPALRLGAAVLVAAVAQLAVGYGSGLYRNRWHFGSFEEVGALVRACALVSVALFLVSRLAGSRLVPDSVVLGSALAALLYMAAFRYIWRWLIDRKLRPSRSKAAPVLLFGAGEGGMQLVTAMLRNPNSAMWPAALLDDDPSNHGKRVRGVVVAGGRADVAAVAERTGARHLIVAIPSASGALVRELSALALDAGMKVSLLPSVHELLDGTLTVDDVRPLEARDLLGRHEVKTDVAQIADYLTGKRVLVTGAGGSIGSELARQIYRFAPSSLVLLDRDESALHAVQLSIHGRALLDTRDIVVADIRDRDRLAEVFAEHRPEVVFHAAALKHLPLLEMHPSEGVKTNIHGTRHVLELAHEFAVEHLVNISSDKAADPVSVLGATKRMAERMTSTVAAEAGGTFLSVRFGNVLGSRGSVLESFKAQIDAGGPVTVTHPDVTRYFMTVEEAVELVIQAGAIGRDGEVLVLDMGQPVRIADVARQLIAHSQRQIDIVYTGLRPGEKLHESLFAADEVGVTLFHPLIAHVAVPPLEKGMDMNALENWSAGTV